MRLRPSAVVLVVLALSGCGGLRGQEPEPSGPWSRRGVAVDREQVRSDAGPAHCGWQQVQFLDLSWPPGRAADDPRRHRLYVKDPGGVLDVAPYLQEGYRAGVALPQDAVDSGYRNGGYALWSSPTDGDARVYLVRAGEGAQAWPRATTPIGCD